MSISPISGSPAASAYVSPTSDQNNPQASQAASAASTPADQSNAASAVSKAMEEATETPVETAAEARHGDRQAQRVMAKREAAKAELTGAAPDRPGSVPTSQSTGSVLDKKI